MKRVALPLLFVGMLAALVCAHLRAEREHEAFKAQAARAARLEQDLRALQRRGNLLAEALTYAQEDRDDRVEMVNELQRELDAKAPARERIERPKFEISWGWGSPYRPGVPDQPAHRGKVVAVDATKGVTTISLGADDGVKVSYAYIVSRDGQYIATIEIDAVRKQTSMGRAIEGISKGEIRVGDKAMNGQ